DDGHGCGRRRPPRRVPLPPALPRGRRRNEIRRHLENRKGAHGGSGLVEGLEPPPAPQAFGEMLGDEAGLVGGRFPVEVDREQEVEMRHPAASWERAERRSRRPRWIRLRTVPTGTATAAAISS